MSDTVYCYTNSNALHPFREENGRSQREFIRMLALKNGYKIHYSRITEEVKNLFCADTTAWKILSENV